MKVQFSKITLLAGLALAVALTFSCSGDGGDDSPSSNSGSNPDVSSSSGGDGGGSSSSRSGISSSSNQSGGGGSSSSAPTVNGGEDFDKWMNVNLTYEVEGSKCYNNNATNCTKYGRLYNWAAAMALPQKCNSVFSASDADCKINTPHHRGLCPVGQHIPTKAEWDALIAAAGGVSAAGIKLRSDFWTGNASDGCNGTNDYGFAALPGGYGLADGTFKDLSLYCNIENGSARWWSASEGGNASYAYDRLINRSNVISSTETNKGDFLSVRCLQDYLPSGNTNNSSSSGGSSSSAGATQSGVGSCTLTSGICAENIQLADCTRGTFSAGGTCTLYTRCLSMENNPVACTDKASCPANEDGYKTFANETFCGGAKGSCNLPLSDDYAFCLDVNRNICEQIYAEYYEGATFQAGECSTAIEQNPCCFSESDGVEFFTTFFSKDDCYSKGGNPANLDFCVDYPFD